MSDRSGITPILTTSNAENSGKERKKLQLAPRTKPIENVSSSAKAATTSSIFGDAKPVDTAAREREIEERLACEKEILKDTKERVNERRVCTCGNESCGSSTSNRSWRSSESSPHGSVHADEISTSLQDKPPIPKQIDCDSHSYNKERHRCSSNSRTRSYIDNQMNSKTNPQTNRKNTEVLSLKNDNDTIGKTLIRYYESALHTDVDFHVQCVESFISFSCHKLVLSLWSSYFAKKFYHEDFTSERTIIELSDVLPSTFQVLIEYCYGKETKLHRNRNDILFLLDVIKAAKTYQITSLQAICIKMLRYIVPNKDNVFELLDAAILIGLESLKLRCCKVLQTQTKHILTTENMDKISCSVVDLVLDVSYLSLDSEYDLISWLFEWASRQFARCQGQEKSMTFFEIMEPYLPKLNFLSLTPEMFAMLVIQQKNFFDEKVGFAILMNIVHPGSWPLPSWCKNSQGFFRSFSFQSRLEN